MCNRDRHTRLLGSIDNAHTTGHGRSESSRTDARDDGMVMGNSSQVTNLADLRGGPWSTVLADPPWRFMNRTGKVAPEHRRLDRYDTMDWKDIAELPVADVCAPSSHCYLWVPNALVNEGLKVLEA